MRSSAFLFVVALLMSSCSMPQQAPAGGEGGGLRELLGLSAVGLPENRWPIAAGPESRFANLPVESAYLFEIKLPFGLSNFPVKLKPFEGESRCVIFYHAGHGTSLDGISYKVENQTYSPILSEILSRGCEVILFEMPHGGRASRPNSNPHFAFMPDGTAIDLRDWPLHGGFEIFPKDYQAEALGLFVLPVHSMTAYLLQREIPPAIGMFGLSGGGWSTALAAATIPEIAFAVAVAGSDPQESLAYDYENSHPVIEEYGYVNLYVDAIASGTDFLHIYNSADPCCFRAEGKDLEGLEQMVFELTSDNLDGSYEIFIDQSGEAHSVRPDTQEKILAKVDQLLAERDG